MRIPISPIGEVAPGRGAELRGPQVVASPNAFGAGVGKAVQGFAGAVNGLADYFGEKFVEAQRFTATKNLSDFQSSLSMEVTERSRNFDPANGQNFVKDTNDLIAKRTNDFLATVPEALQGEFSARANDITNSVNEKAYEFQIGAMSDFAKVGISQAYDQSRLSLEQDGSVENLDAQRAQLDLLIDASPLTPAEKDAVRRQTYAGMEGVSYKTEVRNGLLGADALGVGSPAAAGAYTLLQQFDNLNSEEAKDVANAAEQAALSQVDPLIWNAQADPVKAALLSLIADSEGVLPESVLETLNAGGDIAAAIEALGGDRRKEEAAIVRGESLLPAAAHDADERYANIPYEDRLALRADAEREATAIANEAVAAAAARKNAAVNALMTGIYDGTMGQFELDNMREAGILTDFEDIKRGQEMIDKADSDLALASRGQEMLSTGQTFNPSDTDDMKVLNALIGKTGIAALQAQDDEYAANSLIPLVRQTQVIPSDTIGLLSGMMRSPDRAKSLWALDLLSQLQQASPTAYDAQTTDAVASDVELWRTGKDYYTPEKLQELLQGGDTQEMRIRTEALEKEAGKVLRGEGAYKDLNISGDVLAQMGVGDSAFDLQRGTVMQALPWAAQSLLSDFNNIFTAEFARTGDPALAKDATMKLLKKNWAVSSVGGGDNILMKYPPEKVGYSPIDGSFDWMTEQGREDLGLDQDEAFQLVADEQTRSEFEAWQRGEGPAPSYTAVIKGKDGNWRLFEPWAPTGNRLFFDMKPFKDKQAEEWMKSRESLMVNDAQKGLGQALQHSQQTGMAVPDSVLIDYAQTLDEGSKSFSLEKGQP